MKHLKHLFITILTLTLQVIEVESTSKSAEDAGLKLIMLFIVNLFVSAAQLIYFFLISKRTVYRNWMDIIFYGLVSLIVAYVLQNLLTIKSTLFTYLFFSLIIEIIAFIAIYYKRKKKS